MSAEGPGRLVVSLDFELHWGIADHTPVSGYRASLLGARATIPQVLELFRARDVHATWATVGMLFARDRAELERLAPPSRPTYDDPRLSPYRLLAGIGRDEAVDPFHYARSLIERIAACPGQEIATHTFSHYYCLERGQTAGQFEADLLAARAAGSDFGDVCRSLVLPRNQYNPEYDAVLAKVGVRALRRAPNRFGFRPSRAADESKASRAARFAQSYWVPAGGDAPTRLGATDVMALEGTAFLRPWTPATALLDRVRLARTIRAIERAARRGNSFHLWWHPHNFGAHPRENLAMLEALLDSFVALRRTHGMESVTMAEEADLARGA